MVGWRDELIGRLVHDLKYHSVRSLGKMIAEILDNILPYPSGDVRIIPLPTIHRHIRERGIDHTLLIAKKLARLRGWKVDTVIKRAKDTVQVGADEKTRKLQARDAYYFDGKVDKAATYILFDDVWTTGASMRAAIKKMREAGAQKIIIVVLAVNRIK